MPQLFNKSKINFNSAKLLIEKGLDPPSVHCSYYSSFQLLKHVIAANEGISYEELDIERDTLVKQQNKTIGAHEFLIDKKFLNLLSRERANIRYAMELNQLKTYRRRADYDNIEITYNESKDALRLAQKINEKLNEFLL